MMDIIFSIRNLKTGSHTQITQPLVILSITILLLIVASASYVAYRYGMQHAQSPLSSTDTNNITIPAKSVPPVSSPALCTAERPLSLAKNTDFTQTQGNIDALVQKLAQLQAEVVQLDELGRQLVEREKLDTKEFNFNVAWDNIITEEQLIALEEGSMPEKEETPPPLATLPQVARKTSLAQMQQPTPTKATVAKKEIARVETVLPAPATLPQAARKTSLAQVERSLDEVAHKIEDRQQKFSVLEGLLLSRRANAKVLPAGWPVKQGYLSSGFGWRGHGKSRFHEGVDLVAPANSQVYAVEEGVVTRSSVQNGYGNLVEISHGSTYSTRYAHNTRNLVKVGDRVKKGQVIALVGSTGRATTAHVHFELMQGNQTINPIRFLSATDSFKLTSNIKVSEK